MLKAVVLAVEIEPFRRFTLEPLLAGPGRVLKNQTSANANDRQTLQSAQDGDTTGERSERR